MTNQAATAKNLLALLEDAAETQDFTEAAAVLKRMLQPWGLRLMGPSDSFSKADEKLLGEFWRTLLDLPAREPDILLRAAGFYMAISSASIEREFVQVQKLAKLQCVGIVTLCTDLLSAQDPPQQEYRTSTGTGLHLVR